MLLSLSIQSRIEPIIAGVSPASTPTSKQGAETEYYQTLNPPYEAKNGAIDDLSELLLIKGISAELYWGTSSSNHPAGVVQKQLNRFGAMVEPSYPVGFVDIFTPISTGKI